MTGSICWIEQQGSPEALGRCWGDGEVRKGGSNWPAHEPLCEGHAGRKCGDCLNGVRRRWDKSTRTTVESTCTTCSGMGRLGGYNDVINNGYDWEQAFSVACRDRLEAVQGATCAASSFTPDDVAMTYYASEGENDGADWLWVGHLKDGRWAFVSAWCDYTGWG